MHLIEKLAFPLNQLAVYSAILLFIFFVRLFYAPSVLHSGVGLILFWIVAASLFGIGNSISWSYYLYLIVSLFVGYFLLWLLALIADRWGPSYNSEGFIMIIIPLTLSVFIIFPCLIVKGVIQIARAVF